MLEEWERAPTSNAGGRLHPSPPSTPSEQRRPRSHGGYVPASWWTRGIVVLSQLPMCTLLICVFLLVGTPIFYTQFFTPCMTCFDFEASIAHEVGHVLGFNHPDAQASRNLRLSHPLNATSCRAPLRYVELGPEPPSATPGIMFAFTAHHVRTCLTPDDYEALHALYPTCEADDARPEQPTCVKPRQVVGYLRLIIAVAIPYVATSFVLMLSQQLVKSHYRRRLAKLQKDVAKLQQRISRSTCAQRDRTAAPSLPTCAAATAALRPPLLCAHRCSAPTAALQLTARSRFPAGRMSASLRRTSRGSPRAEASWRRTCAAVRRAQSKLGSSTRTRR